MKKGLGKGLDALFADNEVAIATKENKPTMVKITHIEPNADQPRREFDEEKILQLSESIKEHGVISPIIVREISDGRYRIVAGERRWRASRVAGLEQIPVIIKEYSDAEAAQVSLIENLQREDLNPLEEAFGFASLMQDYQMTQDEVSKNVGCSRSAVTNTLRLLQLPDDVKELIKEGKLSAGHGRALVPLGEKAKEAARKIIAEDLSVRATERMVNKIREEKPKEAGKKSIEVDYLSEVGRELSTRIGAKVSLKAGKKKGVIEIEYYGNDDLERIINLLEKAGR